MDIGLRLGSERFCDYFEQFGLMSLTNIDLPGEAGTIMHKREDIKAVELATMTFGQSFQITPIQMAVKMCIRDRCRVFGTSMPYMFFFCEKSCFFIRF